MLTSLAKITPAAPFWGPAAWAIPPDLNVRNPDRPFCPLLYSDQDTRNLWKIHYFQDNMKNLPTLTALLVILGIGSIQMASAWQIDAGPADSKAKDRTQTRSESQLTEDSPEAVELVRQARNRLFERQSVQAEMVERVTFGNYAFQSGGTYASAPGFRYRLEYQVEIGDLRGTFLEVCDGQVLHTRREIGEAKTSIASTQAPEVELSRRDIQKIRREALGIKEVAQGANLADALRVAEIGIGGLPAVLASLERSLNFVSVRPETADGHDDLIVHGIWNPERKERLFSGMGGAVRQVAGYMPDAVDIFFARETLFPRKIVYLKKMNGESGELQPLVTVEFRNIVLDQPVQDRLFVYVAPPGVEEKDDTASFIEAMRQSANLTGEKNE